MRDALLDACQRYQDWFWECVPAAAELAVFCFVFFFQNQTRCSATRAMSSAARSGGKGSKNQSCSCCKSAADSPPPPSAFRRRCAAAQVTRLFVTQRKTEGCSSGRSQRVICSRKWTGQAREEKERHCLVPDGWHSQAISAFYCSVACKNIDISKSYLP